MPKRRATSVAPTDAYGRCPDDIPLDLAFFSSLEDLHLQLTSTMESNGVRKLYEPSPVPTLYVQDLLGLVPLIPCFLEGNSTFTERKPCLRDQHVAVGIQAPPTFHLPSVCFQSSMDPQSIQV